MEPKISFVIPTHNRDEWVAECIHGLLTQTVPAVELVIVNDGSTDGTKELLDSWLGNNERVKILHNAISIGAGKSRNRGIEFASAPIIGVCDDDDIYPENRAEWILKFFEKCPKGVMMTAPYVRIGYENEMVKKFEGEPFDEKLFKETGQVNYFCHPAAAYTKEDIKEIGGYKQETKEFTDDYFLVKDWIGAGKKIGFAPAEFLCFHRVLPTSIMAKMRGFNPKWVQQPKT